MFLNILSYYVIFGNLYGLVTIPLRCSIGMPIPLHIILSVVTGPLFIITDSIAGFQLLKERFWDKKTLK